MSFVLADGGDIPIIGWDGDYALIERMFQPCLDDIVAYENQEGVVLHIQVDFSSIQFTRRRIYLKYEIEDESDSGTLPEQEESDSISSSDLASQESAAFFERVEMSDDESISTLSDDE